MNKYKLDSKKSIKQVCWNGKWEEMKSGKMAGCQLKTIEEWSKLDFLKFIKNNIIKKLKNEGCSYENARGALDMQPNKLNYHWLNKIIDYLDKKALCKGNNQIVQSYILYFVKHKAVNQFENRLAKGLKKMSISTLYKETWMDAFYTEYGLEGKSTREVDIMLKDLAPKPVKKTWAQHCGTAILSEDLIRENASSVNWNSISWGQILSEDFIREFADKVTWKNISRRQILSEKFIIEFADQVDWGHIFCFQNVSRTTRNKYKHRVDWEAVSRYRDMSDEFKEEFKNYFIFEVLGKTKSRRRR